MWTEKVKGALDTHQFAFSPGSTVDPLIKQIGNHALEILNDLHSSKENKKPFGLWELGNCA